MIIYYAIFWGLFNVMLQYLCRNLTYKRHQLASNILSQINTYVFLLTVDVNAFIGYLLYDTINSMYVHDQLMLIHHIISYYLLTRYISPKVLLITWYFELSNIFLHFYKISQLAFLQKNTKRIIAIAVMSLSICLWVVFRIFVPLQIAITFDSNVLYFVSFGFLLAHIMWIKNMFQVLLRNL